jgi:PAS domain S-box-containing protein
MPTSILGLEPRALLQSVLDNVGVALAVVDHDGRIAFTNQAALDMFGEKASLKGISVAEWRKKFVFHDDLEREIPLDDAPILRALSGTEVKPQEIRVTLPDGRRKWLHCAGHGFSVLGLAGVLVVVTDETEQVELRRSMERAQRIEAIGLMAGGLAHDFNNMLSVLSESIVLALSDEGIQEMERIRLRQMAMVIEKGSTLAARLIRYSRTQKIDIHSVQINDVVTTALQLTRPLIGTRVHVTTELGYCLPDVEADPARLEQVVVNLILNALDAMPDGGKLVLHTELVPAEAVAGPKDENAKQFVLTSITDTGVGIPENLHTNIFDPLFTTKPDGKGTGLGLSSSYVIVRRHNGHIQVQSSPGAGTKFSIFLPVEDKPARTLPTEAA